jgi:hypothetical protein
MGKHRHSSMVIHSPLPQCRAVHGSKESVSTNMLYGLSSTRARSEDRRNSGVSELAKSSVLYQRQDAKFDAFQIVRVVEKVW